MRRFLSFITIFTIFLDDFVLTRIPVDFYFFYIIFALVIGLYYLVTRQLPIDRKFITVLIIIFIVSLIKSQLNGYTISPTVKQLLGILISSIPYYLILKINQFNVREVFSIYLQACYVICIIGILQEISYLLFNIEYHYQYKVTSIVSEPSHLAITLAPAFFVAVNKLFLKGNTSLLSKKGALLILVTWLLTMSAVAMLGLITAVILIAVNKYRILSFRIKLTHIAYIFVTSLLIGYGLTIVYQSVPFIKLRVDDTWRVLSPDKSKKMNDVNLSTYAIYSNLLVTREALKANPLFGSGLGTHSLNYDRYIDEVFNFENKSYRQIELNKEDANSLFLRLLSELGWVGLLLFLYFLYRFTIKGVSKSDFSIQNEMWLINNGCLLFFLMRLMRFGNYSVLGSFLFIFVLIISHQQFEAYKTVKRIKEEQ